MITLRGANIENLLNIAYDNDVSERTFGEACENLSQSSGLFELPGERFASYFQLGRKSEFTLRVEAKDGGLDCLGGGVKGVEARYFAKHSIRPDLEKYAVPYDLEKQTNNIEQVFRNTRNHRLGLQYVQDALVKAGLKLVDWRKEWASMTADAVFGRHDAVVNVGIHVMPSSATPCRDYELEISAMVRPVYAPNPKPKSKRVVYGTPLFGLPNMASAKP